MENGDRYSFSFQREGEHDWKRPGGEQRLVLFSIQRGGEEDWMRPGGKQGPVLFSFQREGEDDWITWLGSE